MLIYVVTLIECLSKTTYNHNLSQIPTAQNTQTQTEPLPQNIKQGTRLLVMPEHSEQANSWFISL